MLVSAHGDSMGGYNTINYTYDARNQLIDFNGLASFEYDHDGRRISATAGVTTNYLWDEFSTYGDVVLETDGNNNYLRNYTLANGMLISQTETAGTLYFLPDAQGSTRALTDSNGALGQTFDYDAFGNLQGDYQSGLDTNYLYTGQQYDVISELYSLRARYYDASIGRFLSRDTWAYDYQNPVELNRYVYTANNPATFEDPSGLFVGFTVAVQTGTKFGAVAGGFGGFAASGIYSLMARMGACGGDVQEWFLNDWNMAQFIVGSTILGAAHGAMAGALAGGFSYLFADTVFGFALYNTPLGAEFAVAANVKQVLTAFSLILTGKSIIQAGLSHGICGFAAAVGGAVGGAIGGGLFGGSGSGGGNTPENAIVPTGNNSLVLVPAGAGGGIFPMSQSSNNSSPPPPSIYIDSWPKHLEVAGFNNRHTGPPQRQIITDAGLYEYFEGGDSSANIYVGQTRASIKTRAGGKSTGGKAFGGDWNNVVYSYIDFPDLDAAQVAERIRIEQLMVEFGPMRIHNMIDQSRRNQIATRQEAIDFLTNERHLRIHGWPDWLKLPRNMVKLPEGWE